MKNRTRNKIANPYFVIVGVYLLAHFFMLILSGCWWDDWTFMFGNTKYIYAVASASGRPEWRLLIPFCLSLPNNGRILIFFLYLGISVFVFRALKSSGLFDEEASLYIALLFSVLPVNDARILVSNFAYTVGLFFFYLGLMLFVKWNKMENSNKKTVYRILLLCLFFASFILNSVLAYYYIIFAYLFALRIKNDDESSILRKCLKSIKDVLAHYPDFFIVPFVFYTVKKVFFPTYDAFEEYNTVTFMGLFKSLFFVPKAMIKLFINLFESLTAGFNLISVFLALCSILFITFSKTDNKKSRSDINAFRCFVYGLIILAAGLIPYVMVRGKPIETIGVKGRDAVLVPFGMAVILYSVILMFKGKTRKMVFAVFIVLGITGFNNLYIEWQKDFYYQLSLENLMNNRIIRNNDTFFLSDLNETEIEAQRYYSLNANALNVFGDETRFFIPKVSNLYLLENEDQLKTAKEELNYAHVMKDYEPDDYCLDAVLNYYCDYNDKDVWLLKYDELFNYPEFIQKIKENGTLDVYVVDDDFTSMLLEEYDKGNLNNDEDVLRLVMEYNQQTK